MPAAAALGFNPKLISHDEFSWRRTMSTATKSKPQTHSKKSNVKLQPLGDRVVVEREESEGRTAGGIVLPDTAKDKPARGVVVSVGDGKLLDDGKRHPLQVKPGNRVIFSSYAGEQFKIGEQDLLLMREEDILAVIE
jgi:chaperonin GroES